MRLQKEEILRLIDEHDMFHEKYIEKDCIVCFNSAGVSDSMTLQEFNSSNINKVSPDRNQFFLSIAQQNNNLIGKKVLEIGVADGKNAMRMWNYMQPKKIWLIDPWTNQKNRAADRGKKNYLHNAAYDKTVALFSQKNSEIIRDFAGNVSDQFEDDFFDIIYIDGDHSYEGCKKDLDLYYPKLKKGGFFGGHDFTGNWNSLYNKQYGVQKAVGEFLQENNKKLQFITLCVETDKPNKILPFDWGFIK